ncbi:restriction endonuclease subunit S [Rummeliibacillus suwonensis]|uniref:restriction endonuclease subunit S n=1 Tax=Rummeliibacillus suwonensis TaxID=1306154 RepID=UPI001AAEC307|nr:restriction endonuclease subunit S [Rummeliibacillus suwonensis]MBO2537639.1 restriction endonuclease subunit S [Rummeliibacillus suwonensis]
MIGKVVPLVTICDFQGGSQPPKSDWIDTPKDGHVRMLQIRDFTKQNVRAEYVPKKEGINTCSSEDILIARYGASIGKVLTGKEGTFNVALIKTIPNETVLLKKYLFYYLKSQVFQNFIKNVGSRAAQAGFNKNDLKGLNIYLPSISNQEEIVKVLDKVQSLIQKRQVQITALDDLTQSLFLKTFGDPKINPFNWAIGTIKDLTLSSQYGSSKKADENSGEFPILRMNNITYNGDWDFSSMKYINLDEKERNKYLVNKGELLFNRTNSKELVGKTAVFREETPMAFAGYLVKIVPNDKGNSEFISAFLNSAYGKTILLSKAKSIVGMANINAEELKNIPIYLPPKEIQDEFASKIEVLLKHKDAFEKGLEKLKTLYNAFLQNAFKGE